jgi:PAS domain S-box-containing protein
MDDELRSREELIEELRSLRSRGSARQEIARMGVSALLSQIPAFLWTVDRDLRLTWGQPEPIQMRLGVQPEIGVTIFDMFEANPEHPSVHAHRAALEGEARNFEVWVEIEGEQRLLRGHVEPLRDSGEAIRGAIGVALDITERVRAEADRERLIAELRHALDHVKELSGLIPICSHCKAIRNDQGYWQQVDAFMREHSNAKLTHAICPDCAERLMLDVR